VLESYLVDSFSLLLFFVNGKEREKQREKTEKLIGVVLGFLKLGMMATAPPPSDTPPDLWRYL
jgi:hypothetical protein